MHRDELIRLAREAGFRAGHVMLSVGEPLPFIAPISATSCLVELERFAALVAAAEREKCAKVCADLPMQQAIDVRDQAAAAIRARKDDE